MTIAVNQPSPKLTTTIIARDENNADRVGTLLCLCGTSNNHSIKHKQSGNANIATTMILLIEFFVCIYFKKITLANAFLC
jgi:hypothetical protein